MASTTATPEELRALIGSLEDETARQRLVSQLKALLAANRAAEPRHAAASDLIDVISGRLGRLSTNLLTGAQEVLDAEDLGQWLVQQVETPRRRQIWIRVAIAVVATFASGFLAEWAVRLLLTRPRRALESRDSEIGEGWSGRWVRLPYLVAHTLLELVAFAAFAAAAYFVMPFVEPDRLTRQVTYAFVTANVIARAVLVVARALLAPQASALRVAPVSDGDANYLFVWLRRFANIGVYGAFVVEAAATLAAPAGAVTALRLLLGLLLALLAIVLVLQNRMNIAAFLAGPVGPDAPTHVGIRRRFADMWHVAAIGYVVVVFFVWGLEIERGFATIWRATVLTILIAAAAVAIVRAVDRLLRRALDVGDDTRSRFPGFEVRANRYLAIVHAAVRTIIHAIAVCAVLEAWGADAFGWFSSAIGRRVLGAVATIGLVAVLAVIVWELTSTAIERRLRAAEREPGGAGARARTLLPLLRNIIMITLGVFLILVALSQFGLDIAPLLAGAGIIGLAVGFGAQTLVKDIITGMFILLENQIAVGDVVRIGSHAGLVEALTIRTLRIRDVAGTVHIVPFSEVTTVENMTRDFSRYVFDVALSYDEDVDRVGSILCAIGAELQADPKYKDVILQPLEFLGLERFESSAVIVRARMTTRPNRQWEVGREFNRRLKQRFDELGVQNSSPQRTMSVPAADPRPGPRGA